ncbi:hypothetical protein GBA63_22450 (plasmid) [Rubrobacter tropicus]|uniref:Uncharacterized protein n=1 Tax=Rubrobacter tropicus TaxID=2653851 RepID=A0A6G8QG39_9ACTN|nr:hypothetical protein [Rubrobacter tropicus]QIN85465.1 hypothetical protein GBA63_22450 [Rubrobacter tropicus]
MTHDPEICAVCCANDTCADCFGTGHEPDRLDETCMSCGGSAKEPPMLPSCSEERCGVPLPGPRP